MTIIPNTDCRIHILACDLYVPGEVEESVNFVALPVVAWEVDHLDDGTIFGPRPLTVDGRTPSSVDEVGAIAALLYYPHEDKYAGFEPFELRYMDREKAEAYLLDEARRLVEGYRKRVKKVKAK